MALLQIAEPGQSQAPHQHKLAIGIDLGTTHSLVATVQSGLPRVLPAADGSLLLPSVVRYLADASVVVGEAARQAAASDALNTLVSVKRFMGRGLEAAHQLGEQLPYELVMHDNGMPYFNTAAGLKSPVEASAEILRVLRERAETALGGDITGAVITVPAYFDEAQRQAGQPIGALPARHLRAPQTQVRRTDADQIADLLSRSERVLIVRDGSLEVTAAQRSLRGNDRVPEQRSRVLGRAACRVMTSQLGRVLVRPWTVVPLQRAPDFPMEERFPRAGQVFHEGIADEGVREPVARAVAHHGLQDTPSESLIQATNQLSL